MNTISQTSLNSSAVQKLYEEGLSRVAKHPHSRSMQKGSGLITDVVSGLVGNVVKAVSAGQRLSAIKRKRAITARKRKNKQNVNMAGTGRRKKRSFGKRARVGKKRKTSKNKKPIKRRKFLKMSTRLQRGRGSRRTLRRKRGQVRI